jgi:soluble lytic murein transglycosylase-like protein
MSNNKKVLISLFLVIILVMSAAVITINNKNQKIDALERALEQKEEKVNVIEDDLETKISILSKTVDSLEKKKDQAEEKLNKVLTNLKIENLDYEDLEKIGDISENTPLDLKTSAVLVNVANKYDLKPSLILSIMVVESNFDQFVVGRDQDRGYMQIIPATEKWLANEFAEKHNLEYNPEKIFEPDYNIELAATYLRLLKDSYGNDYNRILSEYNRGPYNLAKYYEEHKTYSTSYSRVILNQEKKYLAFND